MCRRKKKKGTYTHIHPHTGDSPEECQRSSIAHVVGLSDENYDGTLIACECDLAARGTNILNPHSSLRFFCSIQRGSVGLLGAIYIPYVYGYAN